MRPNLFIIGAAKSGTTSLHHALAEHPDIFMSKIKEPGFFVPEFVRWPKDEEWYLSLFAEGEGCRYRGESSTHYTKRPRFEGVAERVHRFQPDARIVYVMRDPLQRAISHYWHNIHSKMPRNREPRHMLETIRGEPFYRDIGDYQMQIRPWFDLFGERQVRLVVFEELTTDPEGELSDLMTWLDLPPIAARLEQKNARAEHVERPAIVERVRHSSTWERVAPLVPKHLRQTASAATARPLADLYPDESDAVRELLGPWARRVTQESEALVGRSLPWTNGHVG